ACRIKFEKEANIFEKVEWSDMIEFMTNSMINLENTFKTYLLEVNNKLKSR
ncbi:MAG: hypothetical protein ACI81I_000671, partial [Arcobacteraceae bacterium]